MATGFVQRFKGKINVPQGGLFIAGTAVSVAATDLNANNGSGTVFTSTGVASTAAAYVPTTISTGFGLKRLQPGSTQPIFRLPPPPQGGGNVTIAYSTVNGSTGLILTLSTDGSVTLQGVGSTGSTASFAGSGGSTLSNTIKSTQSFIAEILSISTVAWQFLGVTPSTVGALAFSTSS